MALLAALVSQMVYAQSNVPRESAWVPNGAVHAIVTTPTATYIGGEFTYIGPSTGSGLPLARSTGLPAATYPKVNGPVNSCISDGSGGWFVGGSFTHVGTLECDNIAHILADGTVDGAWNPHVVRTDGWSVSVNALAASNGSVYVGGSFTAIGGQPRNCVAAVDALTGTVTTWNPNATGGSPTVVYALAVSGGIVYAGGVFTSVGGQARSCVAALDVSTGLATSWDPGASGPSFPTVYTLVVSGGLVYAGGFFTSIGGQPRNACAALDETTGLATSWDPAALLTGYYPTIYSVVPSGSIVYVGGSFSSIGGQARSSIAALSAATGAATTWDPNVSGTIYVLTVFDTTVYVGGSFTNIGGAVRNNAAALDVVSGLSTTWDPNLGGAVKALTVFDTLVYAAGAFTCAGGQLRNHIAALDSTTGVATSWNPNANYDVYALAVSGGVVYAGGLFTTIGAQSRNHAAAISATTGLATAWDPNVVPRSNLAVLALAVSGGIVYVGGDFTGIGGQPRSSLAAVDAITGLATGWDPSTGGTSSRVRSLAASGSLIYAGGEFTSIGSQPRNNIAALDAATGLATAWNPNADGSYPSVEIITVSGGLVYVGGSFTTIGTQSRNGLAALDVTTGLATSWNPTPNNGVEALTLLGDAPCVGGVLYEYWWPVA